MIILVACDERTLVETRFQLLDRARRVALLIEIGLVRLEPCPLGPPVIVLVSCRDFTRPVVTESETLELASVIVNRLGSRLARVNACLNGELLCWQPEGIEPHRVKHVVPGHPLVTGQDIGRDVALRMSNVEPDAGGIGKHVEDVELRN